MPSLRSMPPPQDAYVRPTYTPPPPMPPGGPAPSIQLPHLGLLVKRLWRAGWRRLRTKTAPVVERRADVVGATKSPPASR
jgi:hypothetical protein